MRKFVGILLFVASSASAQTIGLHLGSQHYPSQNYNNFNPGMYVRFNNDYTIGGYYNSERKMSFYIGKTYDWKNFSVTVGGITGYNKTAYPMIIPSVKLGNFRIALLPKVESGGSAVIHFMYEFTQRN